MSSVGVLKILAVEVGGLNQQHTPHSSLTQMFLNGLGQDFDSYLGRILIHISETELK